MELVCCFLSLLIDSIENIQLIIQGSGKTRVLTSRIVYLLKYCNVKPYEIFAVTFTNKAALEMRHRIGQMLPGMQLNDMWLGTFHGLGLFSN